MTCSNCGGLVTWRGPLVNLTHTQCANCGDINCQIPEVINDEDDEDDEDEDACGFIMLN